MEYYAVITSAEYQYKTNPLLHNLKLTVQLVLQNDSNFIVNIQGGNMSEIGNEIQFPLDENAEFDEGDLVGKNCWIEMKKDKINILKLVDATSN